MIPASPAKPPRTASGGAPPRAEVGTRPARVSAWRTVPVLTLFLFLVTGAGTPNQADDLRLGLIGLDTSHVVAFTEILNNPDHPNHVPGGRVVAAFRGGSRDVEASRTRIDGFTKTLQEKWGVRIHPTIEALCQEVDAVLIESVDGRPHLAQAVPVLLARKPLFIDKPMSASLGEVLAIFRLAEAQRVPVFSSSSLRFGKATQRARAGELGVVQRATTTGPSPSEPHHPRLHWYGIHGVESLFTVMGTGCVSVRCSAPADGPLEAIGLWKGDRTGVFREDAQYGGEAVGDRGSAQVGSNDGYAPLLRATLEFFRTGRSPVNREETIEIFAFMEAAEESLRRGGEPVTLSEVYGWYGYSVRSPAGPMD